LGGTSLTICYRTDTIDLGVVKNSLVNVIAIIKEATDSECTNFGFKKDTLYFTINILANSIPYLTESNLDVSISPNPANSNLLINDNSWNSTTKWCIITLTGQVLFQNNLSQPTHTIDISSLSNGLYFLQLTNGNQRVIRRFVKQ
jgi:nitroimidazol reductase NimA-like FMN-containing flavoprotein (pyridoxamine 5'-phosphate oxidase superfamily)